MSANEDDPMPDVPDADPAELFVTPIDPAEIQSFPMDALSIPEEPDYNMALGSWLNIPALVAGYAVEGTDAQGNLAEYIEVQAGTNPDGKVSKRNVGYLPISPLPPGLWEYNCASCRFYRPGGGEGGANPRCSVVGQDEDPFGGEKIHAQGWCSLWLPPDDREAFAWIRERL